MATEAEGTATLPDEPFLVRRERGLWSDAFLRLRRNYLAVAGGILVIALLVFAILGNTVHDVQRYDPAFDQDYDHLQEGPSWDHFFGTDNLGRDNWARALQGLLISIQVGLGAQVIVLIIGLAVGCTAALGGRALDNIMMRLTDIAYAFPDLLAIILLRSVLADRSLPLVGAGASQRLLIIFAISFVAWVTVARLVRGQMLSLKARDFVIAAEAMGASRLHIVVKHMLPNSLGPVIVALVFGVPLAIFAEAVLGFVGLGIQPPTVSLGRLINDGHAYLRTNYWILVWPALFISMLMLCFTFLGDGLRDALDPRSR
jgi:oligopeptide transport system permease protein